MRASLKTLFLGKELSSPLVLPAGILGMSASSLRYAMEKGFGLVTSKSLSLEPRMGHDGPVVAEYPGGILNSMGLCNPGIEEGLAEINQFVEQTDFPVLVSLFATNREDFLELVRRTNDSAATFIELNLSCPNVMDEYGIPLSCSRELVSTIVEGVKRISRLPVLAKLSPNAMDVPSIARVAEQAGADAVTLINTLGPGLLIDPYAKKPVLRPTYGGVSGPGIKPIALKIVFDCARKIDIPIIGMGGVSTALDAVEMCMAGATLVGVGSAVWQKGLEVVQEINEGILRFLESEGYRSVADLPRLSKPEGKEAPPISVPSPNPYAATGPSGPVWGRQPENGRVTVPLLRVREEGPSAKTFFVPFDAPVKPGQFFMVTDYQGGEKPISVSELLLDPEAGQVVGLTIKGVGPFTRRFQGLGKGSLVSLRGPYGKPFSVRGGRALLVGGGCGIAPLHFLAQELLKRGVAVTVVNGARTRSELLFGDRFYSMGVRVKEVLEDQHQGKTAVDAVRELIREEVFDFAYASGPELMLANLRPLFRGLDYEFLMERYMKCGVGICGSCVCDPLGIRVCVEGPAMGKEIVEQLTDLGNYKRDAAGKKIEIKGGTSSCLRDTP